jgi:gluconolactonase
MGSELDILFTSGMPNRVVLAETVSPGDKFEIAVFGINGPISVAPANFIFFRQASIEFYK